MENTMYLDLITAQSEIEKVSKDGTNPFFKSEYTTLNATIGACKEVLNKNRFAILQPIESDVDGVYVCTTLIHISGEKLVSRMRIIPTKVNDPQAQGSAITYARRYALKSMLCMSDKDDDGELGMARLTSPTIPPSATNAPSSPSATHATIDRSNEPFQEEVFCKVCNDLMDFKQGTTKAGKSYKGYFCKTDKNHEPLWIK